MLNKHQNDINNKNKIRITIFLLTEMRFALGNSRIQYFKTAPAQTLEIIQIFSFN